MATEDKLARYSFHVQASVMDAAKRWATEQSTTANRVTVADVLRELLAAGKSLRDFREEQARERAR